jgi:hypothetical protein
MPKKLGWCAREMALEAPYKAGFEVSDCQKDHRVSQCGEACPDWPWPEQKPANSSTWPKG